MNTLTRLVVARVAIAGLAVALASGCARNRKPQPPPPEQPAAAPNNAPQTRRPADAAPLVRARPGPLRLSSLAFADGGEIPQKYTCEGEDGSPPLTFSGVPPAARSLVLIVEDPDAPDPAAPKVTWVHWVLYNIPPRLSGLTGNATRIGLPAGIETGRNSWQRQEWGGPCPPIGRHRYFHRLYALDVELSELRRPSRDDLLVAMEGHVLATATLMGTYEKRKDKGPPAR